MYERFLFRYLYFSLCSLFTEIIEYIKVYYLICILFVLLVFIFYKEVYIVFIKWLFLVCVFYYIKYDKKKFLDLVLVY